MLSIYQGIYSEELTIKANCKKAQMRKALEQVFGDNAEIYLDCGVIWEDKNVAVISLITKHALELYDALAGLLNG